jgi:hypothetical protein
MTAIRSEQGAAMLMTMMALLLMTAICSAVILTSSSETRIAAYFRQAIESRDAAEAIIGLGMADLVAVDWALVINGEVRSTWIDGMLPGRRALSDGSSIDLAEVANMANCDKATACSTAELTAVTADRPWGTNNPHWMLYAYGALRDLLPSGAIESPCYVVLLAGAAVVPPGWSGIALHAEAFGPRGVHAVVEATVGRAPGDEPPRLLSWRAVR